MVLCPPFKWSAKGGFNLSGGIATERRETIVKVQEESPPVVNGLDIPVRISQPISKTSSASFISNGTSRGSKDIDMLDQRYSNAGPKTISEIMQTDTDAAPRRKAGVIGPPSSDVSPQQVDLSYLKYEKDEKSIQQIKKAILANDFLKNVMYEDCLDAVVEAMSPKEFSAASLMIREGESGNDLFVSAYGEFEVLKGGQVVKTFGSGEAFGELAILYKAKRFASIRCITDAKVWTLDRKVFKKIMFSIGKREQTDNVRFMSSVPLMQGIHPIELEKISEFLKREFFPAGTVIVRQGDRGDKFYIIRGGTVVVTKREGDEAEKQVGMLRRGEFFGEQALLHEDRRLATVTAQPPGAECLTLERGPFTEFLGNLDKLKDIRHAEPRLSQQKKVSLVKTEFEFIDLQDLEIRGTMGVGGFGRVELVQYKKDKSLTFALKCLKKVDMVQQQQQEHVYNEKNLMLGCKSTFIARLYRTFKDSKYIYFLMEPVLGGDVWTSLQKYQYFPNDTARFMAACVIEAFHYLHTRNIVYRDLKPENLMFDRSGYIKLVDFGFAKRLSSNMKTWTFAGTPEYVAPEIVLNKGHDRAVDCWTLGILIHELLVGKPPFRAPGGNHMKTYTLILRGIDAIAFNHRVSKSAQLLIRKLCRPLPAERLGYLKNGLNDVKGHKWFLGLDWSELQERRLKAPLIPSVANDLDLSNFEKCTTKDKMPPDENSGWDVDF